MEKINHTTTTITIDKSLLSKRQCNAVDYYAGDKLRQLREKRGLTQRDLANVLNVSFQQIAKYESGKNRLTVGRISQLCKVFKVRPNCFFQKKEKHNEY